MLTEKGMDAEQADALSKLFKARAKVASKWASSPMEWFNNLGLQFNNASNKENNTVLNGSVTYEQGRKNKDYQGEKYFQRLNKIKKKGISLDLNSKSEFDRIEEFYNKSKNELLEKKREELEKQGLEEEDIKEELLLLESDWKFDYQVKENSKYYQWQDSVDEYVAEYSKFIAEQCEKKVI